MPKQSPWGSLPSPDQFKILCERVPHYASNYWHGIFASPVYREVATALAAGSHVVTDLDYTAYRQDAGFSLVEAAIHIGLIDQEGRERYRQLSEDYAMKSPQRTLEEKTRDEFNYYCASLQ